MPGPERPLLPRGAELSPLIRGACREALVEKSQIFGSTAGRLGPACLPGCWPGARLPPASSPGLKRGWAYARQPGALSWPGLLSTVLGSGGTGPSPRC